VTVPLNAQFYLLAASMQNPPAHPLVSSLREHLQVDKGRVRGAEIDHDCLKTIAPIEVELIRDVCRELSRPSKPDLLDAIARIGSASAIGEVDPFTWFREDDPMELATRDHLVETQATRDYLEAGEAS
jgi:hypothetical protein